MNNETIEMGSRFHHDRVTKYLLMAVASAAIAIIFLIIIFIFGNSTKALGEIGLTNFITGEKWSPLSNQYGALPIITGTILVTLGAIAFAVPIGIGSAIYISEVAPKRLRKILKTLSEIFAGIPSVVYGFFGLVVLVPFLRDTFPGHLAVGNSWLAGSILLGIMALPTIISVSEDALKAVPSSYREASMAMGATKWETTRRVVTPAAISGISAAVILGMGRAIGETMAVMMVCGNAGLIPDPLYDMFSMIRPITASLALEMPEIVIGSTHQSALFLLALILMVMVLIISVVSKKVVDRTQKKFGETRKKSGLTDKIIGRIPTKVMNGTKNTLASLILILVLFLVSLLFLETYLALALAVSLTVLIILACNYWIASMERNGDIGEGEKPSNPAEFIEVIPSRIKHYFGQAVTYIFVFALVYMAASLFNDYAVLIGIAAVALIFGLGYAFRFLKSDLKQKMAHTALTGIMVLTMIMLAIILSDIVVKGLPALSVEFLTEYPRNAGRDGGIYPAIVGTLKLIAGTMVVALPLGILSGVYLAEYAKDSPFTNTVRWAIDILNGTPSIVFGLFGMSVFVMYFGLGFSLLAGCVTLGFMVLPVIIRTTEEALKSVPNEIREASLAMGASKWETTSRVVLPAALGGVITGIILSIGRAAGETAPIMFTAVVTYQRFMPMSIMDPVMALPYQLYYLATEGMGSQAMQYGVALVLLIMVLSMFVLASVVRHYYDKKIKW